MELSPFRAAFHLVANEQKKLYSKTQKLSLEVIEQILGETEKALDQLQSGDGPASQHILDELKAKLTEKSGQLKDAKEQLELEFQNYERLVTMSLYPDISEPCREFKFDTDTIKTIIASHFYQQGLFDIGDCLISEVKDSASMKSSLEEMDQILSAMKTRDLEPALNWATINRDKLKEIGLADFELKLHSLQFVKILKKGKDSDREAIQYSRDFLAPFAFKHEAKFKKLMGCLVYVGMLDNCPYTEFLSTLTLDWDKLVEEFTRLFCILLGQSDKSPLSVTVAAAGVQHLSSALKTMADMRQVLNSVEQLSVNVDLDRESQFHFSFVCPISLDQSVSGNPPVMMPSCNHVLSWNSIRQLPVNENGTVNCPYC